MRVSTRILKVIDEEYLGTFIKDDGSAFKLVVGIYGGGKTHFLYCVRDIGWRQGFAVSYVSLKSGGECPFDRLDLVYKAIASGLLPPVTDADTRPDEVKGVENYLRYWYAQRVAHYLRQGQSGSAAREVIGQEIEALAAGSVESISFRNAIVQGLRAVMNGEDALYSEICQWLKGESSPTTALKRLSITQKVDKTTAFSMIRSLGQALRLLGHSGLVVLLDESELIPSLRKAQREQLLSNLREFIDECGKSSFQGMMVFYAVPDRLFLEGRTQVYDALRQRLSTTFEMLNPTGVIIDLNEATGDPTAFLCEVGSKMVPIYNAAFNQSLPPDMAEALISRLAETVVSLRFADAGYKRVFVQRLVMGLGVIHRQGRVPDMDEIRVKSA